MTHKRRLRKLAAATKRSASFLAADAIAHYLDLQEWQMQAIKQGIAAADAGQVVPHEKVEAWLKTWGRKDESEAPR